MYPTLKRQVARDVESGGGAGARELARRWLDWWGRIKPMHCPLTRQVYISSL